MLTFFLISIIFNFIFTYDLYITSVTTSLCASDCQNGGTCSEFGVCECRQGFQGKYCEIGTQMSFILCLLTVTSHLPPPVIGIYVVRVKCLDCACRSRLLFYCCYLITEFCSNILKWFTAYTFHPPNQQSSNYSYSTY